MCLRYKIFRISPPKPKTFMSGILYFVNLSTFVCLFVFDGPILHMK